MHIDRWTQRKPSWQGAGALACGVLTLGLLSGATLSQDGGGSGKQGGNKGGAETAPARPREQPGQAKEDKDVGDKLADQLARLHEEFTDRFRSALVDADVGRFGKPVASELVVTMFQGLIVAGYPVAPGSAEGTPNAGGRDNGENGQAGGASQGGGANGQGGGRDAGASAKGGQEAAASKAEGQLIGVVIVGGTGGSNRPAPHAGAVEAGSERNAANTGRIGEGSYGVFLMTPNMVALRSEEGTTLRTIQIRHDAGAAQNAEHGGAAPGEGRSAGQGEKGEKGEGGVGAGGQRPSTPPNDTARPQGDSRPAWDRVYLAVLMEIGEGPQHEGSGGASKH